jgi:hypothetical protein
MLAFENQKKNVWCPEMSEPGSGKPKFLATGLQTSSVKSVKARQSFISDESLFKYNVYIYHFNSP